MTTDSTTPTREQDEFAESLAARHGSASCEPVGDGTGDVRVDGIRDGEVVVAFRVNADGTTHLLRAPYGYDHDGAEVAR